MFDPFLNIYFHAPERWLQEYWIGMFMKLPDLNFSSVLEKCYKQGKAWKHSSESKNVQSSFEKNIVSSFIK
jgi:hypothetical protein